MVFGLLVVVCLAVIVGLNVTFFVVVGCCVVVVVVEVVVCVVEEVNSDVVNSVDGVKTCGSNTHKIKDASLI